MLMIALFSHVATSNIIINLYYLVNTGDKCYVFNTKKKKIVGKDFLKGSSKIL